MAENFICSLCYEEHPIEDCTIFDDRELCPDCLDEYTCICSHCGERIWQENAVCDENLILCQHCVENYYGRCNNCDRLVLLDDLHYLSDDSSDGYCEGCYRSHMHRCGVHYYSYKPTPIFYGDGPRYMGVELEIDEGGESHYYANQLQDIGNADDTHIYIKHDGSLKDGLEIVSHPMTLDYHCHQMPWREVIQKALALGYTSHQAGTCGLHVHVNRDSLGYTYRDQEDTIARILFLVENHWHEFLKFSRRTQRQMDKWAARYGRKDDPKAVLDSAQAHGNGRYSCVNLENTQTIEFRMFRGTLKYSTFIATLQMVERICDVALYLSDDEVKSVTWSEFVTGLDPDKTPELVQYLKERRLYVNEPIEASEEV